MSDIHLIGNWEYVVQVKTQLSDNVSYWFCQDEGLSKSCFFIFILFFEFFHYLFCISQVLQLFLCVSFCSVTFPLHEIVWFSPTIFLLYTSVFFQFLLNFLLPFCLLLVHHYPAYIHYWLNLSLSFLFYFLILIYILFKFFL